ncbi:esterase-like activity of phytase family protein [Maridesulfovibrio frigidus]|uniref:esterase-like activity of phytase family protein n=1 Tax=Maridesulfovibrio frigidus TaxID=340956 RepID=UPI0004E14B93|nr:esterase-like activity of phytase family protein [Maridesulfovibrio frigidus]
MKKIIIFLIILICASFSMIFGASTKLKNAEQPVANPITIKLSSKPIGPLEGEIIDINGSQLKYMGAIVIDGSHPAFGGFSDLIVSDNRDSFLTITDMGFWLRGKLLYSKKGHLIGVSPEGDLGQLLNLKGETFSIKYNADAEALTRAPGSGYLVAYERVHRINHYNSGKELDLSGSPTQVSTPHGMDKLPNNGGVESLLLLPDGRLLVIAEGDENFESNSFAAVKNDGEWINLEYERVPDFRPTSAANLPNGKILTLERSYTGPGSLQIRLCVINNISLKSGSKIIPKELLRIPDSLPLDNYEGLDIVTTKNGGTFIYIISDDNFSPLQKTILMMFELKN